jgi:hypothetical protein
MKDPNTAPNPFRKRPTDKNSLKIRTLEAFEIDGPMTPAVLASRIGFYPARSAYSYLLRLHRFGLLERRNDIRGFLLYAISQKGRERLAWLRANRHR